MHQYWYKNYHKISNNVRQTIGETDLMKIFPETPEMSEISKMNLEHKILASIVFGFRLNVGKPKYNFNRDNDI